MERRQRRNGRQRNVDVRNGTKERNRRNVDAPSVASCESSVSGGGAEVRHGQKNSSLGRRSGHVSAVFMRSRRLFEHVGSLLVKVARRARWNEGTKNKSRGRGTCSIYNIDWLIIFIVWIMDTNYYNNDVVHIQKYGEKHDVDLRDVCRSNKNIFKMKNQSLFIICLNRLQCSKGKS